MLHPAFGVMRPEELVFILANSATLKYEPGTIVAEGDCVIIHGRFSPPFLAISSLWPTIRPELREQFIHPS
jgi:hypothetical protein